LIRHGGEAAIFGIDEVITTPPFGGGRQQQMLPRKTLLVNNKTFFLTVTERFSHLFL
jgi:hypothetical protein